MRKKSGAINVMAGEPKHPLIEQFEREIERQAREILESIAEEEEAAGRVNDEPVRRRPVKNSIGRWFISPSDLEVSERARKILARLPCQTVYDLQNYSRDKLLKKARGHEKIVDEIAEALRDRGLALDGEIEDD